MKLLFPALLFLSVNVFSQNSNTDTYLEFKNKLSGVKYADFGLSKMQLDAMVQQENQLKAYDINGMRDFLLETIKLNGVIVTPDQRREIVKNATSLCEFVYVNWSVGNFVSDFMAVGRRTITINFSFCDDSKYTFTTDMNINGSTRDFKKAFIRALEKKFVSPFPYDSTSTLSLKKGDIIIKEDSLKNLLQRKTKRKDIEGIYQLFSSENNTDNNYRIGILEVEGKYKIIYLGGVYNYKDWTEGEIKGEITPTLSKTSYLCTWIKPLKIRENASISFIDNNTFDVNFSNSKLVDRYIRLF